MDSMTLSPIILHALLYGVLLCGVLFPLVLGVVWLNPEIMLNDYPPDIQAKYGPMSERSKRQRIPVSILVIAVMLGIVILSFQGVRRDPEGDLTFFPVFLHLLVMFSAFNLLDWLVLDWLIVVTIRPRFMILPGTEGLAGYGDYWIHFRGFLIGIVITLITSLLVAGTVAALF